MKRPAEFPRGASVFFAGDTATRNTQGLEGLVLSVFLIEGRIMGAKHSGQRAGVKLKEAGPAPFARKWGGVYFVWGQAEEACLHPISGRRVGL
jgi:hypothetical protein